MSMDVQALSEALGEMGKTNSADFAYSSSSSVDKGYVAAWVNAYYFGEDDLMLWLEENSCRYRPMNVLSLMSCCETSGAARANFIARLKKQSSLVAEIYSRIEMFGSQCSKSSTQGTLAEGPDESSNIDDAITSGDSESHNAAEEEDGDNRDNLHGSLHSRKVSVKARDLYNRFSSLLDKKKDSEA